MIIYTSKCIPLAEMSVRFAVTVRERCGTLVITLPYAESQVIAQAKGLSSRWELVGKSLELEVEL
jgi:hypothetical protein